MTIGKEPDGRKQTPAIIDIVIDTDPGIDDAIAILLALAAPDALRVRAITVVAGNVSLALAARNARQIVELAGRTDVPIHAGCAGPLQRTLETAEAVHGTSGLGACTLPPTALKLVDAHAVDALIHILETAPARSITLCPLGPLTNIATALMRAPALASRIRAIVLMGGAIGPGNITSAAEFNFYVDPQAAACVFAADAPIVMIPLDATHQALATPAWVAALGRRGTRAGRAIADMLAPGLAKNAARGRGGVPLHDVCVIGYLLWPALFGGTAYAVEIETQEDRTIGRSIVDRTGRTGRQANALVIETVDAEAFFDRLGGRLAALP